MTASWMALPFNNQKEVEKTLNQICSVCGEYFGRHRANSSECPIIENKRTIGFHQRQYFKNWEEN